MKPSGNMTTRNHAAWVETRCDDHVSIRHRAGSTTHHLQVDLNGIASQPALPGFTPDHKRLVIPNEGSDNVIVFDLEQLRIVGCIPLRKGSRPWQVKTIPAQGHLAYVTNSAFSGDARTSADSPSTVALLDLKRNVVLDYVQVGSGPNGVTIDRQSRRGYVMNMRSNDVSVLDVLSHRVVATIPVGKRPAFGKLTADGRTLVVTNLLSSSASIVATDVLKVRDELPIGIPNLSEPFPEWGAGDTTGVAVTDDDVAFFTNYRSHTIVRLDLKAGEKRKFDSPIQFPFFVEVDRHRKRLIVSSGVEGKFAIWDEGTGDWIGVYRNDGSDDLPKDASDFNFWMTLPEENKITALLPRGIEGISDDWERNIVSKFL